ncbi:MAG TPA: RHS repeat-associated core domain-containing protein [Gemmatimonadaceae bacterium]
MTCFRRICGRLAAATRIVLFALAAALLASRDVRAQARMDVVGVSRTRVLDYWTYAVDFTITNTGNAGAYAWVKYSCGPYTYEWDGSCAGGSSGNIGWVSPGGYITASVWVYIGPNAPANGVITQYVTASSDGTLPAGATWASGNATFNLYTKTATFFATPLTEYRPVVTPKAAAETAPFNALISRSFAIQNSGSRAATYSVSVSCGVMSGCTQSKTTTSLAPGATDSVFVSFRTPNTVSSSNTVKLIATYTEASQSIADTGSRPIVTPAVRPVVSPKNGTVTARGGAGVATFFADPSYSLTPLCQGWATNCAFGYRGYDEDSGGWIAEVTFSAPNALGSATYPSAAVKLIGTLGIAADTGVFTAYLGYSKPSISPKTQTITEPAGVAKMRSFSVTNTGNAQVMYTMRAVCTGLTNCTLPLSSYQFTLAAGASGTVWTDYVAPPTGVTGTMKLIASTSGNVEADTATLTVTGADMIAPTLSIWSGLPGNGTTINNGALTVNAIACDIDGQLTTPTATINGNATTATFVSAPVGGCTTRKTGTFTFVARPGSNTFAASVGDGVHTTNFTSQFIYNELPQVIPVVTAQVASRLLRDAVQFTDTFLVRNPGPVPATYSVTAYCSAQLSGCTTPQPSVTVAAGQTAKVPVSYTTVTGPVGVVGVTVRYTGVVSGTTITVSDAVTQVNVDHIAPTIAMTSPVNDTTLSQFPTIAFDWCDADGQLATHTVTLDGVALPANYTSRSVSGCTSAGASSWPSYAVLLGTHTLVATATDAVGHVKTLTRTFTLSLPAVTDFQPQVTPRAATSYLIPAEQTWAFAVRNAGTRSALYQVAPDCSQIAAQLSAPGCRLDRTTLSLAAGAVDTIRLTFALTGLPTSQKTVGLVATYTDIVGRTASHTGVVTALIPTMAQLYQPALTATNAVVSIPPSSVTTVPFDIKNLGLARVTYQMGVSVTAPFTLINIRDTITVEPGQTLAYIAQPFAPATIGTRGTITVWASYMSNGQSVSAMATQVVEVKQQSGAGPIIVDVTPKDVRVRVTTGELQTQAFVVFNKGSATSKYSFKIRCFGLGGPGSPSSVTCPDSTGETRTLGGNSADTVYAAFTGTSTEADGLVRLVAKSLANPQVQDSGSVVTWLAPPGRIALATAMVNPGNAIERGACLTVAIGQGSAYECGDLRLVHALATTTTMNTARTPMLIYNSRHAEGRAFVAGDISVKQGSLIDTVRLTLKVKDENGAPKVEINRTIAWQPQWSDDQFRRFVLGLGSPGATPLSNGASAGAFPYTFEVRSLRDTNDVARRTGTLIVVDRSQSVFGRGWWLDGLEQLVLTPSDSMRVWVGGDGSVRVYKKKSATRWVVDPVVDRPDTLLFLPDSNTYRRILSNGAYVEFDFQGRHVRTRNRQGHVTRFFWTSRLDSIGLPVPAGSQATRVYTFNYANNRVVSVDAPNLGTPRRTLVHQALSTFGWRVDSIGDPDAKAVRFAYDAVGRIEKRITRMKDTTVFHYDEAGALDSSRIKMLGEGPDIVHGFCAAETTSLTACAGVRLTDEVRTKYDGPRLPSDVDDTTAFYVNRFGAPTKIVNALGKSTTVEHDLMWPLLVKATVEPNRHRVESEYDPVSALLLKTIDKNPLNDGHDAVTGYSWIQRGPLNLLDQIRAPTGEVTKFGYTPDGDREWQEDDRGSMSRAWFSYNTNRQLKNHRPPGNLETQLETRTYDPSLGNLETVTSPGGAVVTYRSDAIGRVDSISTPLAGGLRKAQRFEFDKLDRVLEQYDIGPAVTYPAGIGTATAPAETLRVSTTYDDDGNPLVIWRRAIPDMALAGNLTTTMIYDHAGRKVIEYRSGGAMDSLFLDPAGNVTATKSGRALKITSRYDALNRLVWRVTPSVSRDAEFGARANDAPRARPAAFPHFNGLVEYNTGGDTTLLHAWVVPRDSAAYAYDENGRLIAANNSEARVTREYFNGGALDREVQTVGRFEGFGKYDDSLFMSHRYILRYTYDASGRRLARRDTVPTCIDCVQSYSYLNGFLESTTDGAGSSPATFAFKYDSAGRLKSRTSRGVNGVRSVTDHQYDEEGRLTLRTVDDVFYDQLSYDPGGRILTTSLIGESTTQVYNGLGALTAIERRQSAGTYVDEYVTDAVGRRIEMRKWVDGQHTTHRYEYSAERLDKVNQVRPKFAVDGPPPPDLLRTVDTLHTEYDGSGNAIRTFRDVRAWMIDTIYASAARADGREWTWNVYGADERLRVSQRSFVEGDVIRTVFSEYRYDALGRRILTRSRWDQYCQSAAPKCVSALERTIWDGDQMLMELRARTVAGEEPAEMVPGSFYGTVRYTHAGGIDEPLALWKLDKGGIIPHRSWRGTYEAGTGVDLSALGVTWPGKARDIFQAPDARLVAIEQSDWIGSIVEGKTDPSGLQYMRNRYYDPRTGRFTQEDPIGLAGGLNLYGFANGDPVNFSDPFGLCPIEVDLIPCTFQMGVAGALGGALVGGAAGAAGGTFVLPGVGTLVGGGGGALFGGAAGLAAGTLTGAARDATSVVLAVDWGEIKRKVGRTIEIGAVLGGILTGGPAGDLARRWLDIQKTRAAAVQTKTKQDDERKKKEKQQGGGSGGGRGDPPEDGRPDDVSVDVLEARSHIILDVMW